MTNFALNFPILFFTLVFTAILVVPYTLFLCWNRFLRHLNIRKVGWPPPHCDADGDFHGSEEP